MDGKMRAQVFYEPEVMKLEMVDIPKIADNEVLVRVKATGICGSDISYYYGHGLGHSQVRHCAGSRSGERADQSDRGSVFRGILCGDG